MNIEHQDWFSEWFDSPYYHILYKHRDDIEAESFINKLINHLKILPQHKIMDLACGRGRHAIYLNKKGFDVTGTDLSPRSIEYAKQFSNSRLNFFVHDMREVFAAKSFDLILNLFTSFGYFDQEEDNYKAIKSIADSLKKDGLAVIDFMNTPKVIASLVKEELVEVDGIKFCVKKKLEDGFITKDISFHADGKDHHHIEKVKAIGKEDFIKYFNFAGLQILEILGDYQLNQYSEASSDRMIFTLKHNT
ncbi:MAG TPA: methyltransferase domain-containing protein [Cytophagaceae bacterium]|jgi:SAM-dependent methyltransferase|nr:methyltransferase domain-containing protein [Cytophagaceae bacterium]